MNDELTKVLSSDWMQNRYLTVEVIKERGKKERDGFWVGSRYERGAGPTYLKGHLRAKINCLIDLLAVMELF